MFFFSFFLCLLFMYLLFGPIPSFSIYLYLSSSVSPSLCLSTYLTTYLYLSLLPALPPSRSRSRNHSPASSHNRARTQPHSHACTHTRTQTSTRPAPLLFVRRQARVRGGGRSAGWRCRCVMLTGCFRIGFLRRCRVTRDDLDCRYGRVGSRGGGVGGPSGGASIPRSRQLAFFSLSSFRSRFGLAFWVFSLSLFSLSLSAFSVLSSCLVTLS